MIFYDWIVREKFVGFFVKMVESTEIQVQYKGKVYTIPIEHDNTVKLEHVKKIDAGAVGIAHYNAG